MTAQPAMYNPLSTEEQLRRLTARHLRERTKSWRRKRELRHLNKHVQGLTGVVAHLRQRLDKAEGLLAAETTLRRFAVDRLAEQIKAERPRPAAVLALTVAFVLGTFVMGLIAAFLM